MDDREIAATAPPWFTGDIDGVLTKLEREVERCMRERRMLVAAVYEALEYFEDRADVGDGDYGQQVANTEMLRAMSLREVLRRIGEKE